MQSAQAELEFSDFPGVFQLAGRNKSWYPDLLAYLRGRYLSIERRLIDTFRFVDCHSDNAKTFSFEFSSILRDAGSCFSSVMDKIVREGNDDRNRLNIGHYAKYLSEEVPKVLGLNGKAIDSVALTGAELRIGSEARLLRRFLPDSALGYPPRWWDAYNNVKHSDFEHFRDGNLESCLNAVAALAALWVLCEFKQTPMQLFVRVGLFSEPSYRLTNLFCRDDAQPFAKP